MKDWGPYIPSTSSLPGKEVCIVGLARTTVILTVALLALALSLGTYAQTELPWYWWNASPTIPQTYGKCSSLRAVPLDFDAFQVGCYDLYTGLPLNCHEDWTEFFSTDGLQDPATILYYEGGHAHPRSGDVAMTTGGLYSDLSGVADTNTFTGDTGGQIWTGYKYHPQCSGVVQITARCIAPPNYHIVPDDCWHVDPSDPSGRTGYSQMGVRLHVDGLVELPSDPSLVVVRNAGDHPVGDYVKPAMSKKLVQLAQEYRNWYHSTTGVWVRLSYNDMSLPWGGIFDFQDNWDCPHELHRVGTSADVNHYCPVDGGGASVRVQENKLNTLARALGLIRYEKQEIHYELVGG